MTDRMQTQRDEFDKLVTLYKAYSNMPPVVDDDYPEMRHYYEREVRDFITALKANRPDEFKMLVVDNPQADLISAIGRVVAVSIKRCKRWHGEAGLMDWSVLEWAGAMCGEAGEAANVAKKISRAEHGMIGNSLSDQDLSTMELLDKKLAQECADVFLYLVLLAARRNIDLGSAIIKTFNDKSEQLDFPERL